MFVDPLLGNTDDPTLDPDNLEVRIKELANCSEESIGPFFLVKYIPLHLILARIYTKKQFKDIQIQFHL